MTDRRHWMRVLVFSWACAIGATPLFAQASGGGAAAEAAIRALIGSYEEARNRPDPKAVEALFTGDADQLVSSGEWRKGRAEVVRGTLASSRNTGGKRRLTVESIRFLAAGVALADCRYDLTGLQGGADRHMWSSFLLKREAGGWRIAAIRNMLPAAPAR